MTEPIVVQEPVVTPEPPKEFAFDFQPTDEMGNKIGGLQVIKYDGTPEDLGRKMADQNTKLIALNRKINKELRLSSSVKDTIPDTAPRFDESKYELKPEPLTAEERMQLVQDIQDPEKFEAAQQRLVRATIGDPNALRTRLARVEQRLDRTTVQEEALAFKRGCPDYFPSQSNLETLAAWMYKNNLDPIKENFQLAYDTLKDVLEVRPAPASVVQPTVSVQPEPQPAPRPVSSGLTRSNASDSGPVASPGSDIVYEQWKGYEALERMPGDEYKRRLLREPGFKEKVQALDNARAQKRAGQ
jgi:hypothetical protein